jgi:hypothetical protein
VPFRRTKACKNDHIANSVETIAFCIPVQSAENKRNTGKYLIDAKAKFFISRREVVRKAQYILATKCGKISSEKKNHDILYKRRHRSIAYWKIDDWKYFNES